MERVVKPIGIIRWQLQVMPFMVVVFILGGAVVSVFLVMNIAGFAAQEGYGLAAAMAVGVCLWWAAMFWLARTYLVRVAQEVRYSPEGGIVIKGVLAGETAVAAVDVTLLRQRLFFPFPGAYTLRHVKGVNYISAGEGFRDFERYLRRENRNVVISDV